MNLKSGDIEIRNMYMHKRKITLVNRKILEFELCPITYQCHPNER